MSQNETTKDQKSTGATVLAEVADVLKDSAPSVRSRLVSVLTERELAKRVDLLDKALVKRQALFIETKKLKPKKMVVLNEDGSTTDVPVPMTPEEVKKFQKAVKEANEKLAKFDDLLEKAFTGAAQDSFDKLAKQVSGAADTEKTEE